MTELQQRLLDEIMDNFDFGKVAKTLIALNWETIHKEGDQIVMRIRDEPTLRRDARELLKRVLKDPERWHGCAGLWALWDAQEEVLTLQFRVSEWDAYEPRDQS